MKTSRIGLGLAVAAGCAVSAEGFGMFSKSTTLPLGALGARAATTSCAAAKAAGGAAGMKMGIFDGIQAKDIDGKMVDLGKTYGQSPAVMVVNLASE